MLLLLSVSKLVKTGWQSVSLWEPFGPDAFRNSSRETLCNTISPKFYAVNCKLCWGCSRHAVTDFFSETVIVFKIARSGFLRTCWSTSLWNECSVTWSLDKSVPSKHLSWLIRKEAFRKVPDTFKCLRQVMRAICLSDQSTLIDVSLWRIPLNLCKSSSTQPENEPSKPLWVYENEMVWTCRDLNRSGASPKLADSLYQFRATTLWAMSMVSHTGCWSDLIWSWPIA